MFVMFVENSNSFYEVFTITQAKLDKNNCCIDNWRSKISDIFVVKASRWANIDAPFTNIISQTTNNTKLPVKTPNHTVVGNIEDNIAKEYNDTFNDENDTTNVKFWNSTTKWTKSNMYCKNFTLSW